MPFSQFDSSYDPDTLDLLKRVFEQAWREVQVNSERYSTISRDVLAARILQAAGDGERDPVALMVAALGTRVESQSGPAGSTRCSDVLLEPSRNTQRC